MLLETEVQKMATSQNELDNDSESEGEDTSDIDESDSDKPSYHESNGMSHRSIETRESAERKRGKKGEL